MALRSHPRTGASLAPIDHQRLWRCAAAGGGWGRRTPRALGPRPPARRSLPDLAWRRSCGDLSGAACDPCRAGAGEHPAFDAHLDLYDDYQGNKRSHASPFARIMEQGLARRLVQVGIRTLERRQRAQVERFGVEIIPMRTFSPFPVPIAKGRCTCRSSSTVSIRPWRRASASRAGRVDRARRLNVLACTRAPLVGADIVELNPDRNISMG